MYMCTYMYMYMCISNLSLGGEVSGLAVHTAPLSRCRGVVFDFGILVMRILVMRLLINSYLLAAALEADVVGPLRFFANHFAHIHIYIYTSVGPIQ